MASRIDRQLQRDRGADQAERGFVGDPLKLPFARMLQEVQNVRLPELYRRFVQAGAAALTLGQQEGTYQDAIKGLSRRNLGVLVRAFQQLILDMDDRPYLDLLGPLYMEISHKLDRDAGSEFFTPHNLSRLMARMNLGPDPRRLFPADRPLLCNEPTAGTGGMVLAFTEILVEHGISPLHTQWVIQDLSARSCHAAFINATVWGIPAHVVCGNTLTLDVRWQWTNLHWHAASPLPCPTPEELESEEQFKRVVQAMKAFLGRAA